MIVLVCGGRRYSDRHKVYRVLDSMRDHIDWVVHGGATGADSFADDWAHERGKFVAKFPIYGETWNQYGYPAGPIRNEAMFKMRPDLVIAFPGGKGTANAIRLAERYKVGVREVE